MAETPTNQNLEEPQDSNGNSIQETPKTPTGDPILESLTPIKEEKVVKAEKPTIEEKPQTSKPPQKEPPNKSKKLIWGITIAAAVIVLGLGAYALSGSDLFKGLIITEQDSLDLSGTDQPLVPDTDISDPLQRLSALEGLTTQTYETCKLAKTALETALQAQGESMTSYEKTFVVGDLNPIDEMDVTVNIYKVMESLGNGDIDTVEGSYRGIEEGEDWFVFASSRIDDYNLYISKYEAWQASCVTPETCEEEPSPPAIDYEFYCINNVNQACLDLAIKDLYTESAALLSGQTADSPITLTSCQEVSSYLDEQKNNLLTNNCDGEIILEEVTFTSGVEDKLFDTNTYEIMRFEHEGTGDLNDFTGDYVNQTLDDEWVIIRGLNSNTNENVLALYCIKNIEKESLCGNEVIDEEEECDGKSLDNQTCNSLGYASGTLSCSDECEFDKTMCDFGPICGDGDVNGDEECDTGNFDGMTCQKLGYDFGELICDNECKIDSTDCSETPICGNGKVEQGEECDGNNLDNTTCENLGYESGTLSCLSNCKFETDQCVVAVLAPVTECGDGECKGDETCESCEADCGTCPVDDDEQYPELDEPPEGTDEDDSPPELDGPPEETDGDDSPPELSPPEYEAVETVNPDFQEEMKSTTGEVKKEYECVKSFTGDEIPEFSDIEDHYAKDAIMALASLESDAIKTSEGDATGVFQGYTDGTFRPNAPITRAEMTKIALLITCSMADKDLDIVFEDIENPDKWYYDIIRDAKELGIVHGYGDNYFRPNNNVTRAETLKIILAATGHKFTNAYKYYADVSEDAWYTVVLTSAYELNISRGYADNLGIRYFEPDRYASRAEVAIMIYNTIFDEEKIEREI